MRPDALFLDSAYPIALASATDQHHAAAVRVASALGTTATRLITTRAVLLEIGNSLAKPHLRAIGTALLRGLENDPQVEVVPLNDALYRRGLDLFDSRGDKAWSLTDCISFVVMGERDLTEALTSDQHFEQAGFTALLRH
jgi:predicted nucleic acid-binding protein